MIDQNVVLPGVLIERAERLQSDRRLRLDTIETLLEERGGINNADFEAFLPSAG